MRPIPRRCSTLLLDGHVVSVKRRGHFEQLVHWLDLVLLSRRAAGLYQHYDLREGGDRVLSVRSTWA